MRKYILVSLSLSIATVLIILYLFNLLNFSKIQITEEQEIENTPKPGIFNSEEEAGKQRVDLNNFSKDLKLTQHIFLKNLSIFLPESIKYLEEEKIAKIILDEKNQAKIFRYILIKGQTVDELDILTSNEITSPIEMSKISKETLMNNISFVNTDGSYRNIESGTAAFEFQGIREVGSLKFSRFQNNNNEYIWIAISGQDLLYVEGSFLDFKKASYFEEYILGNFEINNQ